MREAKVSGKSRGTPGIIRVLIVDDHTIVREGIVSLLRDEADIDVIGEAGDGREALRKVEELRPDIVVLDIALPGLNGLEALRTIRRDCPKARVVMLTMYDNEEYVRRASRFGASGYVLKDAAGRDLVGAIRRVMAGDNLLDDTPDAPEALQNNLTPRETEVLQLVAEGHTNREIAEMLCLSVKTVETHRGNLLSKLNMHDRTDLVKYAIRIGLVHPNREM